MSVSVAATTQRSHLFLSFLAHFALSFPNRRIDFARSHSDAAHVPFNFAAPNLKSLLICVWLCHFPAKRRLCCIVNTKYRYRFSTSCSNLLRNISPSFSFSFHLLFTLWKFLMASPARRVQRNACSRILMWFLMMIACHVLSGRAWIDSYLVQQRIKQVSCSSDSLKKWIECIHFCLCVCDSPRKHENKWALSFVPLRHSVAHSLSDHNL